VVPEDALVDAFQMLHCEKGSAMRKPYSRVHSSDHGFVRRLSREHPGSRVDEQFRARFAPD
jgi:hypothetical protein